MPEPGAADSLQQGFAAIPQILRHLKAHATPNSPRVAGSWSPLFFDAGSSHAARRRPKFRPHLFCPRIRSVAFDSTSAFTRYPARCQLDRELVAGPVFLGRLPLSTEPAKLNPHI